MLPDGDLCMYGEAAREDGLEPARPAKSPRDPGRLPADGEAPLEPAAARGGLLPRQVVLELLEVLLPACSRVDRTLCLSRHSF